MVFQIMICAIIRSFLAVLVKQEQNSFAYFMKAYMAQIRPHVNFIYEQFQQIRHHGRTPFLNSTALPSGVIMLGLAWIWSSASILKLPFVTMRSPSFRPR
jgi:hypothetical protein